MTWGRKLISIFLVSILFVTVFQFYQFTFTSGDLINPIALSPHNPIHIIGDGHFILSNDVVGGDGSIGNPYIIENCSSITHRSFINTHPPSKTHRTTITLFSSLIN